MGIMSSCCKLKDNKDIEADNNSNKEKNDQNEPFYDKTSKPTNVIDEDEQEYEDEKVRNMIEKINKEIQPILDKLHQENMKYIGAKCYDEQKAKMRNLLDYTIDVMTKKMLNFELPFDLKELNELQLMVNDVNNYADMPQVDLLSYKYFQRKHRSIIDKMTKILPSSIS